MVRPFLILLCCTLCLCLGCTSVALRRCYKNSKISYAVLPFVGDKYGAAEKVAELYKKKCYRLVTVTEMKRLLGDKTGEFLKVNGRKAVVRLGEILTVDFIVYGSAGVVKSKSSKEKGGERRVVLNYYVVRLCDGKTDREKLTFSYPVSGHRPPGRGDR